MAYADSPVTDSTRKDRKKDKPRVAEALSNPKLVEVITSVLSRKGIALAQIEAPAISTTQANVREPLQIDGPLEIDDDSRSNASDKMLTF